jgi:hypothetical protein
MPPKPTAIALSEVKFKAMIAALDKDGDGSVSKVAMPPQHTMRPTSES